MAKIKLRFEGYPQQLEALKATEKTVVFQAGAGAGKTLTGAFWTLKQACEKPGSRGMAISPSHPQMEQSYLPHLLDIIKDAGLNRHIRFSSIAKRFDLPWNGSRFWLRSADKPESLLGADLAWIYGDEVALWKPNAWKYAVGRLRQPGYANQFFITMTPKGKNWTFRKLAAPSASRRIIRASTYDNVYIRESELWERMREDYGEGSTFWEQEALGEYVAYEGLVYLFFEEDLHVRQLPPNIRFDMVIAGIDWGWSNPFVILVAGVTPLGVVWILDEVYETERSDDWQVEKARALRNQYGIEAFFADPSEPGYIAKFRNAGLNCLPANNEVIPGIAEINGLLMNRRLVLEEGKCPNLIREFGEYQWKKSAGGEIKPDEPEKRNDHAPDALRYLWHSRNKVGEFFAQVL